MLADKEIHLFDADRREEIKRRVASKKTEEEYLTKEEAVPRYMPPLEEIYRLIEKVREL
jgi:hypothetical protein